MNEETSAENKTFNSNKSIKEPIKAAAFGSKACNLKNESLSRDNQNPFLRIINWQEHSAKSSFSSGNFNTMNVIKSITFYFDFFLFYFKSIYFN